ncbi:hypothetical protein CBD41_07545 [bacterium TMED181]|nr:hypothetical protein [Planctomycetota bacterium]OUW43213.1 MAG: hypothetical protein CBD41_07545 [bacterium TMED181]
MIEKPKSEPDPSGAKTPLKPDWVQSLTGSLGNRLAFVWGFMEASVFFIVPDMILSASAIFDRRAALKQTALAVGGALIGGALIYVMAQQFPEETHEMVSGIPFVGEKMFDTVREDLTQDGAVAMLYGPTSGIPYKIYASEAPPLVPISVFLLMTIPARLMRLLISVFMFSVFGYLFRSQIENHPKRAMACHGIYWIGIYAYYWSVI